MVPWDELLGVANKGHAAISDLLLTRAAHAVLSSNFDQLIENWARERKFDLRGALNGQEAVELGNKSSPLVKFHGCMERDREHTVWTSEQFTEQLIQTRIQSCTEWIHLHLPGKHLVVVGFWSDWGYLNNAIASALLMAKASAVTVVDPQDSATLEKKAPDLWRNLRALSGSFEHVPMSGADFLDALRLAFSKSWARRFYALAPSDAGATDTPQHIEAMNTSELYDFRRDAEGVPYSRSCTLKAPPASATQAAFARRKLLQAGATREGAWLKQGSRSIRVVNGAGQDIEKVRARYREEPVVLASADIVVCAGGARLGLPARIFPAGKSASVVRPGTDCGSQWLSLEETQAEVGL